MPGATAINWSEFTWNPVTGCSRVTPECVNCYAEIMAGTDPKLKDSPRYHELTVIKGDGRAHWTGKINYHENTLLHFARKSKPGLIFPNSMSDLFHENVQTEWLDSIFAAMLLGHQHIYQVLTKRPARMAAYINDKHTKTRVHYRMGELWREWKGKPTKANPHGADVPEASLLWPAPFIWLGASMGCQESAEKFAPHLCSIAPGWFCWISAEPLIGRLSLRAEWVNGVSRNRIGWVVSGGESGRKEDARPMLPAWEAELRGFCAAQRVPYWYKQKGNWLLMEDYDRARFLNDAELMEAAAATNAVCALDSNGKTVRGAKVASETLKGGVPLFWYDTKKEGTAEARAFPPFPETFTRGAELAAAHPFNP